MNLWDAESVQRCLEDAALLGGTKVNYAAAYQSWCEPEGFE